MKKLFKIDAFSRSGFSTLTDNAFMSSVAGFILYGLIVTYFSTFVAPSVLTFGTALIIAILALVGCIISTSNDLATSFCGYTAMVACFGILLAPTLNIYSPNVVSNAILLTGIVTGSMIFAGITFPRIFSSIGGALFYSLIALLIIRVFQIFIPQLQTLSIIDYFAAALFSLYIGYDMYRASVSTRTRINALHIAVSLYLDILNLYTIIMNLLKK